MSAPTNQPKNKRQQLLDAALALFVNQGIYATSTASIAKTAGVATGTLFHHFPSKDALVLELYKNIKQEFALQIAPFKLDASQLEQQAKVIWQQAIEWALANAEQQQFCLLVMQYQPLSAETKAQIFADEFGFLKDIMLFGQQQQLIADYPIELMLESAHGQFLTSSQFFINNSDLAQDNKYREAAFNLFWQSLIR
ncbi:TetR/AcrR family transcriptional regulator [Colwellia psychrerythraea]|uniref:Transcriptional regulator, TetR family n=1 Tax=Colwellia psychrerythraea TaxID=28229 RepID=A0A099K8I6_COLPS|nr:TetR/AcrR family transcriptional regulator [Colwellia psychrerythraea]KGJ87054.1 transcriptional regulator, TetR family [Colwellia psychrerythraea]